MPYGQRTVWFQLVAVLVVFFYFALRFSGRYSAGLYDGPDGLASVGALLLWFVAAGIVVTIAVHILGSILLAIAERDPQPDFTSDERDRAIELKGERVSQFVTGAGCVGSMVLLAAGTHPALVFFLIFAAFTAGSVIGSIVKLFVYNQG